MIRTFIYTSLLLAFFSCSEKKKNVIYSYDSAGYYYQLISFSTEKEENNTGKVAKINVAFKTQSDSVFWDSFNNLNNQFYTRMDSSINESLLKRHILRSSAGDSLCLFIKPEVFFKEQFHCEVPFFCKGDTAVKVLLGISQFYSMADFKSIGEDLEAVETKQILKYFTTRAEFDNARDPLGFYWIDRPSEGGGAFVKAGDAIRVAYKGQYLSGRYLESSVRDFEFIYGTPDQLIKGLNFVIAKLKLGQNAKIILPSRLAFGEYGSSNGAVPPYTPLIYEIHIKQ